MEPRYLPLELVLNIITCSLPPSDVMLPPAHHVTKALLTWTLVCHETRRLAKRYLRERCVYLSSPQRLSAYLLAIKKEPELRSVTTLSLSPFGNTIDDLRLCCWVGNLLNHTCESLRRLVIDIPLRSLYPEDDHLAVRRVLREGFERLENLEEFVSTRDELYLEVTEDERHPAVWRCWKKLKRLALYNVDLTLYFFSDLASLAQLETLVLSRSDGDNGSIDDWAHYFVLTDRPFKLLMLGSERRRFIPDNLLSGRIKSRVETEHLPMIRSIWLNHTIDFSIEECQAFVREHAERGTLWTLDEGTIPCNARPYVDEPYLAKLGMHWLMLDERRRAWSVD
ncbi:uncharacterized protein M421DRAFT_1143 [Didymella exigua CBS 183.55]|uniref:F-box domain-containing protein n=1 Tax=Didymella exigua CBS 183.55 TaxID=1150837 RepID=A0A6A5S0X0_9PLEO|nr:uncharacterized protein M421DRAFT_1143 [Didymella exigua CBS 183.55]KAF1933772.1 hypothetical protein M421DRAFT_1143 [Didymella exigua CBS 183.55]